MPVNLDDRIMDMLEASLPVKFLILAPLYFRLPYIRRITVEKPDFTGRIYFVCDDRIVAVAVRA